MNMINVFIWATTVVLNQEKIKNDQQRISKIKPFRNKHNCDGIKYPPKIGRIFGISQ